jgi:hypothetical protein
VYSGSTSTNATLLFDVLENCTLKTVKVDTDTPGERMIEVKDNTGAVIHSASFTLVEGEQILDLNFALTPGTGYTLGTNGAVNQTSLGYASPRLKRNFAGNNGTPYSYPFAAGNVLNITNSSAGNLYYFYFYNWEVESELTRCISTLVPVNVTIDEPTGISTEPAQQLNVYPNPSKGNVRIMHNEPGMLTLFDVAGRVVRNVGFVPNTDVDFSGVAAGTYILKLDTKAGIRTVKLTIE